MLQINVTELAAWLADEKSPKPQLIDVREAHEWDICHIEGSQHVAMNTIPARLDELDPSRPLVCICHHGGRSMQVAIFLARNGFGEVYNMSGGVEAWATQIDKTMARY
jgi:rhodanese-related sulfurtransferase